MKSPDILGQFEQIVLTAVLLLGDRAYGIAVHSKVEELSGRKVLLPAVYVTLDRMEDKGYLASRFTEPTPERGGRSKRCFRLQPAGERALAASTETSKRLVKAMQNAGRLGIWKPRRAR